MTNRKRTATFVWNPSAKYKNIYLQPALPGLMAALCLPHGQLWQWVILVIPAVEFDRQGDYVSLQVSQIG
jgi:hypothetical protein